jgi:hypothetical protein
MVTNPLSVLWVGRCTIYEYTPVTDPESYQTTYELTPIATDEPCRISFGQSTYSRANPTDIANGVAYVDQTTTLFTRPDLPIKEGSVIEVTQHNVTNKYKRASKPATHSQHQEVLIELYEDNA